MLRLFYLFVLVCAMNSAYALPNPASVNCTKQHHYELMLYDDAGTLGICVFSDHSYCEEWAYLRGECKPGKFYWPEKIIDYKNPQRYCLIQGKGNSTIVAVCKNPRTKPAGFINQAPPARF